jgi:hypothetical protein
MPLSLQQQRTVLSDFTVINENMQQLTAPQQPQQPLLSQSD